MSSTSTGSSISFPFNPGRIGAGIPRIWWVSDSSFLGVRRRQGYEHVGKSEGKVTSMYVGKS